MSETMESILIFAIGILYGILITYVIVSINNEDKTQIIYQYQNVNKGSLTDLEEWVDEDINTTIQIKKEKSMEIQR